MRDVMALSISIRKLQPAMPPSFEHCYAGSKTVAVRSAVREIIYANFKSYRHPQSVGLAAWRKLNPSQIRRGMAGMSVIPSRNGCVC